MTWQPIETAPKDGTEILAWRVDYGVLVVRWTSAAAFMTTSEIEAECRDGADWVDIEDWFCADFIAGCRLEGSEAPTHWMPLPPPPDADNDQPVDGLCYDNEYPAPMPEKVEEA